MARMTANEARRGFCRLLETANSEPVHIVRNGEELAVVLSVQRYAELVARQTRKVNPVVETLLQRSIERHGELYQALAKYEREHPE